MTKRVGRPLSTVRRWVRSVRASHTEWLRAQGITWIHTVDRETTPSWPGTRPGRSDGSAGAGDA